MKVDLPLIRKYNVAAPRYTSYPPATHFTAMPAEMVLERIRLNNHTTRDLSLYFHLPFCRSLCWYCGCTTVTAAKQTASASYLKYLKKEIELMRERMNPRRQVVQIHFGGGTPTFLLPEEIKQLGALISSNFQVAKKVEAGVEIDPRRLTREHVTALKEAGFRRASIGVQDFDIRVQRAVNRIQPFEITEQAMRWLREDGFESINIDLMYGLPYQNVVSFENTLRSVLSLRPDRIATFSYAHVPWLKPAQKHLPVLPPETKLALLKLTVEKLTSQGFDYIGMDHFARSDDELSIAHREKTLQRNFQGYSTCGQADIYAFGLSSISQANGTYWQNHKTLPAYYGALETSTSPIARGYILSADDKIRRELIMRLMCDLSLDFDEMSDLLGVDFRDYFSDELASLFDLEVDGLIEMDDDSLIVTDIGRLLIRVIAERFDAYRNARAEAPQFSKSV